MYVVLDLSAHADVPYDPIGQRHGSRVVLAKRIALLRRRMV